MTARDIITDALMEIGAISQTEVPSSADAAFCLRKLNRMFDRWAAEDVMAYNVTFSEFDLIASHSPHTIGPSGDFTVNQRPVRIESAQFQLSTGSGTNPAVWTQIALEDDDWWAQQTVPDLTSAVVTHLYYSPDWPNGKCYFWPICTGTNRVKLELWGLLGSFSTLGSAFSYPPGYWDTVINNLAVELAPSFNATISPLLMQTAQKGLLAIHGNNAQSPRVQTADFGMPRSSTRPDYNFLTGEPWSTR
jgi:hypothetical protein